MKSSNSNLNFLFILQHTSRIKDLSIEDKGEYLASCSENKINIHGIFSSVYNTVLTEHNVNSIAIDPFFSKPSGKQRFVTASNKITLYEKGFLSRYKSTIIYQDDLKNNIVRWRNQLIVWSNQESVRIYDLEEKQMITCIKRDTNDPKKSNISNINSLKYKCNFYWLSDNKLLIGWGSSVKFCKINERELNEVIEKKLPRKFVLIPSLFDIKDECICGIAPFRKNIIVICLDVSTSITNSCQPSIKVEQPLIESSVNISDDLIPIKGFENYVFTDYQLEYLHEDNSYFIISPKDVVIAKPKDDDDHIGWLIDKKRFEHALNDIKACKELKKYNSTVVGRLYIEHLIKEKTEAGFKKAASLSRQFVGFDNNYWEYLIIQFLDNNKLEYLEPHIPIDDRLSLRTEIGEIILNYFLFNNSAKFLEIIRKWPPRMYIVKDLVKTVESALSNNSHSNSLFEALAELHIHQGDYEKALADYLSVNNREEIFDLIEKYGLITALRDKMEILMNLNPKRTSELLLENMLSIPLEYVVVRLKDKKHLLLPYLHKVIQKDPDLCIDYHENLVELYAYYEPKSLLEFLKSSNSYSLEKALKICTDLKLIPEVVFLLTRMGNAKKALDYIINSMNDINYAVEFCQQHSDNELWEELFNHSLKNPEHIRILIQNIGTHIPDPISLINRIPEKTKIEGLVSALIKILSDHNLQISLEESCKRILMTDCYDLMLKLNVMQKRGIKVTNMSFCQACTQRLILKEIKDCSDVIIFNCRHMFHQRCLPVAERLKCPACMSSSNKKG